MRTAAEIEGLLTELDHCSADDLEDQDLDFKQWDAHSRDKAVKLVVQMSAAPSRNRDGPCRPALSAYRATDAGAPGQHGAGKLHRTWRQRARRGENRLSNKEIRQIAHFDRNQVTRLMAELRHDHPQVKSTGHGAGAGYTWSDSE